jgi:hypothetical protein
MPSFGWPIKVDFMSAKRRPISRISQRNRRSNKICFSRIRREVDVLSQAVVILRPHIEKQSATAFPTAKREARGVIEGEG